MQSGPGPRTQGQLWPRASAPSQTPRLHERRDSGMQARVGSGAAVHARSAPLACRITCCHQVKLSTWSKLKLPQAPWKYPRTRKRVTCRPHTIGAGRSVSYHDTSMRTASRPSVEQAPRGLKSLHTKGLSTESQSSRIAVSRRLSARLRASVVGAF